MTKRKRLRYSIDRSNDFELKVTANPDLVILSSYPPFFCWGFMLKTRGSEIPTEAIPQIRLFGQGGRALKGGEWI